MKITGIPEFEALAIIWTVKKNRYYLLGRHFKIVTDHYLLCNLKKIKDHKKKLRPMDVGDGRTSVRYCPQK